MDTFEHILILVNPISFGQRQKSRRIQELRSLFPEDEISMVSIPASIHGPGSSEMQRIIKNIRPKTLICIAAGDGSVRLVVDTLLHDKGISAAVRKTPILPLWGGNANDLANMLNGKANARLAHVLSSGNIISLHPLAFTITPPNKKAEHRIAVCNASFGAVAHVARRFNEPIYRSSPMHNLPGGRRLKEIVTAVLYLQKATTFQASDVGGKKVIYERIIANGSRFAKLYRMPVRLDEKRFFMKTIEGKQFILTGLKLSTSFRMKAGNNDLRTDFGFTLIDNTVAQFDGETETLKAGTRVKVAISKTSFFALSTLIEHQD